MENNSTKYCHTVTWITFGWKQLLLLGTKLLNGTYLWSSTQKFCSWYQFFHEKVSLMAKLTLTHFYKISDIVQFLNQKACQNKQFNSSNMWISFGIHYCCKFKRYHGKSNWCKFFPKTITILMVGHWVFREKRLKEWCHSWCTWNFFLLVN